MLKRLLLLSAISAVALALGARELWQRWQQPLAVPPGGYLITVATGDTLRAVAARLEQDGVYTDGWLLRWYGRWSGVDQQIRHGEYLIAPGTTPAAFLELLRAGRVVTYQVTLPEGITLARALTVLSDHRQLDAVLSGSDDPRLLDLVAPYTNAEGWFFPDSYQFERGATDLDILRRAHAVMRGVLAGEWEGRAPQLPYTAPYEALILASIVERETGVPEERGPIAGVFVRRLQKHMLLQTDPTVIYGLGEQFDGNLRRADLQDSDNPYNTYRHPGLPPTPIALPGRAAIHAALHPAGGEALYFVARGDGGHEFSETLAQHQQAVRKYQLKRRADYRSAPGQP